jgi:hypothetical protein
MTLSPELLNPRKARHTPGPWSLPHFAEPDVNCECGYVLTDNLMGAVCTVHASGKGNDWTRHGDNPKFAEAVANARLIAAAPDLLAALKLAQTIIGHPDDEGSKIIAAAIAKAEGMETPHV